MGTDAVVEKDKDQSMRTYCSWRFLLGMSCLIACTVSHIYLLQFLDLTLLAANSANSIVAAIILSTNILGEKFIW